MSKDKPKSVLLVVSLLITCITWPLAYDLWFSHVETAFAVSVFFLGLSLGPCLAAYALVPKSRKGELRRWVLFCSGLSIISLSILGSMNLDLEGFFMLLMAGTMGAAIGHTMITVIAGPMLFGRFLCGWGCWRAMILELLPIGRSPGRRQGAWCFLPIAGLGASIGGAALSFYVLKHHPGGTPQTMHGGTTLPIAVGFAIYYAASISLAFLVKDQRAFCKYLCPSSVILRQSSRLALVKMSARPGLCNDCGACSRVCPMDINVAQFVQSGRRVASGECILCQQCAHACPKDALHLTLGFDLARKTPFNGST